MLRVVVVVVVTLNAGTAVAQVVVVVADQLVNEGVLGALARSVRGAVQTVDRHIQVLTGAHC